MKIMLDIEVEKTDATVTLKFPNDQNVILTVEEFARIGDAVVPGVPHVEISSGRLADRCKPHVTIHRR